jgi:hypothetical protein
MKYRILVTVVAITISSPLFAEDQSAGRSQQPYLPTLADIMGVTQLRHFKLWYAGEVDNWDCQIRIGPDQNQHSRRVAALSEYPSGGYDNYDRASSGSTGGHRSEE